MSARVADLRSTVGNVDLFQRAMVNMMITSARSEVCPRCLIRGSAS